MSNRYSEHRTNTVTVLSSSYGRRSRRMRGNKLTSTHFEHGHLKAVSFGRTIWPQFLQIKHPLKTPVIKWKSSSTTQYGHRNSFVASPLRPFTLKVYRFDTAGYCSMSNTERLPRLCEDATIFCAEARTSDICPRTELPCSPDCAFTSQGPRSS